MSTPNPSKLLLVADRRGATSATPTVAVRRYRLARLRLNGPAGDPAGGLEPRTRRLG